jgi:hypothetical protein
MLGRRTKIVIATPETTKKPVNRERNRELSNED